MFRNPNNRGTKLQPLRHSPGFLSYPQRTEHHPGPNKVPTHLPLLLHTPIIYVSGSARTSLSLLALDFVLGCSLGRHPCTPLLLQATLGIFEGPPAALMGVVQRERAGVQVTQHHQTPLSSPRVTVQDMLCNEDTVTLEAARHRKRIPIR